MTHIATLPGSARQLVEDSDGRIFAVLDGPRAGLALVLKDGVEIVWEETAASAAASLDGFLFFVAGEEDRRVFRFCLWRGGQRQLTSWMLKPSMFPPISEVR